MVKLLLFCAEVGSLSTVSSSAQGETTQLETKQITLISQNSLPPETMSIDMSSEDTTTGLLPVPQTLNEKKDHSVT